MQEIFTIEQLSKLIHKSASSIRSDRVRNPKSLPPSFSLPNSRRVLFKDVEQWIDSLMYSKHLEKQPELISKAKRGRPSISSKLNT